MTDGTAFEVVDGPELARRWKVPATWIRHQVQRGVKDPLPSVILGRYRRFEWGSPALNDWWNRRRTGRPNR
jgi:hypothetical protein